MSKGMTEDQASALRYLGGALRILERRVQRIEKILLNLHIEDDEPETSE
jgi:hypothetical protein